MAENARWRLACSPTSDDCQFIVTQRQGSQQGTVRFDCTVHFGGFVLTAAKKGLLRLDVANHVGEPPKRTL